MSNLSGHGQLTGIINQGAGGGGGGSEVIINPTGSAIGTMEKISVDGNIYDVRNVPDTTSATNGSILTKTASGVGWYPLEKELPTHTSGDNNKVLTVNNDALSWENIPKELPSVSSGNNGDVLTLEDGSPVWAAAGGSSEMTLLYEAQTPISTGVVTLNDNISNYDLICFRIVFNVPTYFDIFVSKQLIEDIGYIANPSSSGFHFTLITYNDGYIRCVRGASDNILNFFEQVGSCYVSKIYGIKF